MLLRRVFSSLAHHRKNPPAPPALRVELDPTQQHVLNVGGGSKAIAIPPHYAGWTQLMLDIDPNAKPDVLLDARALGTLAPGLFDAVYCSHNLEHYYEHDVKKVLGGFLHVLKKPTGFVEIRVPDIAAVAREMVERDRDMGDVLYTSPAGPIRVVDVVYGMSRAIEKTKVDFYAHKTGFTRSALRLALQNAGFSHAFALAPIALYEIRAIAMASAPADLHLRLLGIDADSEAL